jgi:hypothetical protein
MDETSDQIERHIQETRNDLDDNLNELGDRVKKAVDWRAQFEERPGTMLAWLLREGSFFRSCFRPAALHAAPTAGDGSPASAFGALLNPLPRRANQAKHGKTWKPWPVPWSGSL